jgi:hypothetical protein
MQLSFERKSAKTKLDLQAEEYCKYLDTTYFRNVILKKELTEIVHSISRIISS